MSDLKFPVSCDQFEAHVSDYIDGALSASDHAALSVHMAECESCLSLLTDVRAIVGNAAALPLLSSSRDLWPEIAGRLDTPVVAIGTANSGSGKRQRTVPFRVFAAAAALLVSVSSGITYVLTRGNVSSGTPTAVVSAVPSAAVTSGNAAIPGVMPTQSIPAQSRGPDTSAATTGRASTTPGAEPAGRASARFASRLENSTDFAYEREITAMRRIVDERLGDLDSVTVVEIERNLRIIDKAISDSRRALQNDPRSRFLSKQLDRALENKLDIMRRIALL